MQNPRHQCGDIGESGPVAAADFGRCSALICARGQLFRHYGPVDVAFAQRNGKCFPHTVGHTITRFGVVLRLKIC
ncbi:MAG: hypothetical protein O3B13_05125 [Planctomycetota bacterium]|nr:hypothetical protein [Planctomycetota bacterium]